MKKLVLVILASFGLFVFTIIDDPSANAGVCECTCYKINGSCGYNGINTFADTCNPSAPDATTCENTVCSGNLVTQGCTWTY